MKEEKRIKIIDDGDNLEGNDDVVKDMKCIDWTIHSSHVNNLMHDLFVKKVSCKKDYVLGILNEFLSLEPFGMCSAFIAINREPNATESIESLEANNIRAYIAKAVFLAIVNDYDGIDYDAIELVKHDYRVIFRTDINRDYIFIKINKECSSSSDLPCSTFEARKAKFNFAKIEYYSGSYKINIATNSIRLVKDVIVPFKGSQSVKNFIYSIDKLEGEEDMLR